MPSKNPQKISGEWNSDYVLDMHTIKSEFLGYNSYGHPEFDTTYTELGGLLKKAKYRESQNALDTLAETAASFIQTRDWDIDCIVPVPPSNMTRKHQPVFELARRISSILNKPVCWDCNSKIKDTPELKNIHDYSARLKVLKDAFSVDKKKTRDKIILLLDDLYRSGATMNAISKALIAQGSAKRVYALAITKTRSKW
jgi:predicted amidophosphoribosyltransferase